LFTRRRLGEPLWPDEVVESTDHGVADAAGRFHFDIPTTDIDSTSGGTSLAVLAAADGYGIAWALSAKPGEELTLRLAKDRPITGRVLDIEGRPAANAQVRVWAVMASQSGRLDEFLTHWRVRWERAWSDLRLHFYLSRQIMPATVTDHDGRFRLAGVGVERLAGVTVSGPAIARTAFLIVCRDGFDPRPYNQAAIGQTPGSMRRPGDTPLLYGPTFDYVAAPGKTITGSVRTTDGRPVADARLTMDAGWSNTVSAVTDAGGQFRLTGLPKQPTFELLVTPKPNHAVILRKASIPDTAGLLPMTAEIRLSRGVVVQGRIADRQTGQGVDGQVRFLPLPENPYVNKAGYELMAFGWMSRDSDPDGNYCLTVSPGPGVLVVEAYRSAATGRRGPNPYLQAHFDEEDRKHVTVIGSGEDDREIVVAGREGRVPLRQFNAAKWIDLAETAGPITRNFDFDRGRTVTVQIQDPDGRPLTGAVVGSAIPPQLGESLATAECTLHMLDPKMPRLYVFYHPGRKLGARLSVGGAEPGPLAVKLMPTGTVTGRVLDASGRPVAELHAQVRYQTQAVRQLIRYLAENELGHASVATDADGRFRFDRMFPDEEFTLSIWRWGKPMENGARIERKRVASGAVLDLGDLRIRADPP
jgi:protocatechuate 3,4-dioxygenase beta subunit